MAANARYLPLTVRRSALRGLPDGSPKKRKNSESGRSSKRGVVAASGRSRKPASSGRTRRTPDPCRRLRRTGGCARRRPHRGSVRPCELASATITVASRSALARISCAFWPPWRGTPRPRADARSACAGYTAWLFASGRSARRIRTSTTGDAVTVGLAVELLADAVHQLLALVAHHLDEGDARRAHGAAPRSAAW